MFRPEILERQGERLRGNVHLFLPLSWHLIGYGLLVILTSALIFLFVGSYARVETVVGQIQPDLGSAAIVPSRAGIITGVEVSEGDVVTTGRPLATVRTEEIEAGGSSGPEKVIAALSEQDSRLAAQQRSTLAGTVSTSARLRAQRAGIRGELAALNSQITAQRRLIRSAQDDLTRVRVIAERGFISGNDLRSREDLLTSRQQQLAALTQSLVTKAASIGETDRAIDEAANQAQTAAEEIAGSRASVAQQKFNVAASRGYTLTSPVAGTVTALTARIGQIAQTTAPVMTIVPSGARMQAWLYVPTQAVGFIAVGQDVRLQIDAFPYARFGTIAAKIERISGATINRPAANGQTEAVYLAIASIHAPAVYAFGRDHRIRPDMTLTARIITERRSLAEWLFEPILAVRRR